MEEINMRPIGMIHSEFKEKTDVPIQPRFSKAKASIELDERYKEGLKDLEGFSHIILLFYFNRSKDYKLTVRPFLDDKERGLFATRAPKRPNQIGMSIVKLEKIEDNILYVSNIDILDNTPLLDIKPYIPGFDKIEDATAGWIKGKIKDKHLSDERFD